jgi:hypothetical protein
MSLNLIRRLIKGTPLSASDYDGNLDKMETAILGPKRPPLLGIDPAAYGTVTQATSKTTPVTINTMSGRITTASNELGAGVGNNNVVFVVNNTNVKNTDVIVVNGSGNGFTSGAYKISVCCTGNGAFTISIQNISGVAKSEAIGIAFAILKVGP